MIYIYGITEPQEIKDLENTPHTITMHANDYAIVTIPKGKLTLTHRIEVEEDESWRLGLLIKTQIDNE